MRRILIKMKFNIFGGYYYGTQRLDKEAVSE